MEAVQLIAEGLILLLLLYVAFLKSYFQEKGKNFATKEDIAEITAKIESVKAHLQFSLQAGLSLRQEEHNALVDYYSKYIAWFSAICNCSFSEISDENEDQLRKIRAYLEELERDFDLATGRMELFAENFEIAKQHGPLQMRTLKFHGHAVTATFAYAQLLLEIRQMKSSTPVLQQVEPYRALLEKRRAMYGTFKEEQHKLHREIYPLVLQQRSTIKAHIRQLVSGTAQ